MVTALRQEVEVIVVAPEELDEQVSRGQGCLVICSRLTEVIKATVADWVVLYPDGDQYVEMNRGGEHTSCTEFDFDDLLAVIDEVMARLANLAPNPGGISG